MAMTKIPSAYPRSCVRNDKILATNEVKDELWVVYYSRFNGKKSEKVKTLETNDCKLPHSFLFSEAKVSKSFNEVRWLGCAFALV